MSVGPWRRSAALGGWARTPTPSQAPMSRRPAMLSLAGSPVISRYRSSCWSGGAVPATWSCGLLHSRRGRRAPPRAGGAAAGSTAARNLPLHGGGRGPSGDHDHGLARAPLALEAPPTPRAGARGGGARTALRRRQALASRAGCGRASRRKAWPTAPAPLPPAAFAGPRRSSPRYSASCTAGAPSPPQGARNPLARVPRTSAAAGRGCSAARPPPRPLTLQRRQSTAGRGSLGTPGGLFRWSFHSQKEATNLLGARRLRPFIGQRGVTSRRRGFSTGR